MIRDYRDYLRFLPKNLLINSLKAYLTFIKEIPVNNETCYSDSKESFHSKKYDYIHKMLDAAGFVNGEPTKNEFEKNPIANFWWNIYQSVNGTLNVYPFPHHHCSSKELQEALINLIMSIISYLDNKSSCLLKASLKTNPMNKSLFVKSYDFETIEADLSPIGTKNQIVRKNGKVIKSWEQ